VSAAEPDAGAARTNVGNGAAQDSHASLRRGVYALLAVLALGGVAGRILAVNSVDRLEIDKQRAKQGKPPNATQRPFLSANDRSRWCTIRALVELGTYEIDEIIAQPNWDTIDMVKHDDPRAPGEAHLYSSKPPLLPTLLAGEYWVIHRLTGRTLGTHPYEIGRLMLLSINGLGLVLYFFLLARIVERYGTTDWGRLFVFAAAAGGTFLTTFANVLNNHLIAAIAALVALDSALEITRGGSRSLVRFAVAGLAAAFAASCELPALAFTVLLGIWLARDDWRRTLAAYLPAALLVAVLALGTNYVAHGTVVPAYGKKDWYDYTYIRNGEVKESYWRNRAGIDRGEKSRGVYAWHTLVGHHGIFSLTPIWLLSVGGAVAVALRRGAALQELAWLVILTSGVCWTFYVFGRPTEDRNYGGMSSGLRWMFWFTPLWLVVMLPATDWLARRRSGQVVALLLLGFSVLAATYPTWNPWTHPWLTNLMLYLEWIRFD
jgi:hypothetical protein